MKRRISAIIFIICISLFITSCSISKGTFSHSVSVRPSYYAALLEMDSYSEEGFYTRNLPMNFINTERMRNSLLKLGWDDRNILVRNNHITPQTITDIIKWFKSNSKKGDTILFYIFGHGTWIETSIGWNTIFVPGWKELKGRNKLLLVDCCNAEKFIRDVEDDNDPHISIAAVSDDEVLWAGVKAEGLPILGSVFNFYFTDGLVNTKSDTNRDGIISIEEAFCYTQSNASKYTMEKVLPYYIREYQMLGSHPEFKDIYPNAVIDNKMPTAFSIRLNTSDKK